MRRDTSLVWLHSSEPRNDSIKKGAPGEGAPFDFRRSQSAASSAPQFSQYHSVGKFIVPQSLHFSVFTGSSPDWAITGSLSCVIRGARVAKGGAGGSGGDGGLPGSAGWYCAPLARRGDTPPPRASSVTDLRNASSSTGSCFFSSALDGGRVAGGEVFLPRSDTTVRDGSATGGGAGLGAGFGAGEASVASASIS